MALGLAGCGLADSHASLPEILRVKPAERQPLDPQPDVRQLMHDRPDSVFVPDSHPSHIMISALRRVPNGPGWTVCVRADVTSVTGRPMGMQTYVATIESHVIIDRRRSDEGDNCESETYTPL